MQPFALLLLCSTSASASAAYSDGECNSNSKKKTTGIITDGQVRRKSEKQENLQQLKVKDVMTKNPISVNADVLAAKALSLMNSKRITFLCVHRNNQKNKTIGVLHIHNILENNIQ